MGYLSSSLRDRFRSLGVGGDFPMVPVFRLPDSSVDHLHPECLLEEVKSGLTPVMVPLLDTRLEQWCGQCLYSTSWPQVKRVLDEIIDLDQLVSSIIDLGHTVQGNDPEHGRLRPEVLGNALSQCHLLLTSELTSFELAKWWEFAVNAGGALVSRVEAIRDQAAALLRSPGGVAATQEALRFERMSLPSPRMALFCERATLSGVHLAALVVYGRELVPVRFVVEGSTLAVGALERVSYSGIVYLEGHSEDVIATALALWEPDGTGPMSSAAAALGAASILLSTSGSNA